MGCDVGIVRFLVGSALAILVVAIDVEIARYFAFETGATVVLGGFSALVWSSVCDATGLSPKRG